MSEEFPAAPQPWPDAPPAPKPVLGTNGLAIAALVLGLFGFLGLTTPAALILGIVALVQISRTRQAGRGLAIGGIVAGCFWLAVAATLILDVLNEPPKTPTVFQLAKGACYTKAESNGDDALQVSCTSPHDGEVFGTLVVPGEAYPGQSQLENLTLADCNAQALALYGAGNMPDELIIGAYIPDERAWNLRMRTAVCTVHKESGLLTEPVVPR